MMEPERWYEYQKNYQKYGFDMKPKPEPNARAEKTASEKDGQSAVPAGQRKENGVFCSGSSRCHHDHADHRDGVCSQYPV